MIDDVRLLSAAAQGDDDAYARWLEALRPELLRYAADRLGGDRAEAEDVLQDAAVRALMALRRGRVPENPRAWIYVIVRNRCHDVRGARRAHAPLDDAWGVRSNEPSPDELAATRRRLEAVVSAVGALPDTQRRALVSATLEGRPYEEIATREATSVQAVKSLVHRARRGLEASGARAAALLPGLWAFRGRVRGLGGGAGEGLAGVLTQHTAAVAGVAVVAAAAVPVAGNPVERHHAQHAPAVIAHAQPRPAANEATVPSAATPAPPARQQRAAMDDRDSAKAAAAACASGASLDRFTAHAIDGARRQLAASDAEYATNCAPQLLRARLAAG